MLLFLLELCICTYLYVRTFGSRLLGGAGNRLYAHASGGAPLLQGNRGAPGAVVSTTRSLELR